MFKLYDEEPRSDVYSHAPWRILQRLGAVSGNSTAPVYVPMTNYGALYEREGKQYMMSDVKDTYDYAVNLLATPLPEGTTYFYAEFTKEGSGEGAKDIVHMPTALTGVSTFEDAKKAMEKAGFKEITETRTIQEYCKTTSCEITFTPKASSGGSGAAADPVITDPGTGGDQKTGDQKTEAPKSGDTIQQDNGDFKLTEDKSGKMTAEFSSNEKTDSQKTVMVPDVVEVNGEKVPVTSIADNAFSGNSKITNLKFKGKNLKKIGKNAFSKCPNLKKAVLPDSVTEIGLGAFDGDKKMNNLTVNGNNLKKVGKNALRGIKKNATVTIKAKNESIYKKVVKKFKKAGNKKLKFKFKKAKK